MAGALAFGAWKLRKAMAVTSSLVTGLSAKIQDMNARIVDLETEPDPTPKSKDDDDMMASANSWIAQAAAAERGEGVRV